MKLFRSFLFAAFATIAALPVRAQFTAPVSPQSGLTQFGAQKASVPPTSAEAMTFGSSIAPAEYHLGPGDVFSCYFWTSGETFYPTVSADNMLMIPNLGAFDVRNKTLADLETAVQQKISESFSSRKLDANNPPVTLALYAPRKIYVTVKGDVETPGTYMFSASSRANLAVDIANKIDPTLQSPRPQMDENRQAIEQNGQKRLRSIFGERSAYPESERYITIAHDDGTTDRLDLVRYDGLHDPNAAPPLREGDVISIPYRDMNAGSLGVYGAVQSAGDFEFVQGDSLLEAIKYAFGPSPNADLHHVELTRVNPDGSFGAPQVFDLTAIEAHTSPDVPLMPNDRIIVRSKPEEHLAAVVEVQGQVVEPGPYPIVDGKTTLSEIIQQAGGLTKNAYPAAGIITRHGYDERLSAGTPEEISAIMRLEDLGVADTGNLDRQLASRPPNVNVDMEKVLGQGDHAADVTLKDGDEISIPTEPTTVYVGGFVNYAGYVNYQSGAPLSYYIAQAGGYANGAEKSETAVIKLRTKAWMDPRDTKIEAGDEIFVPKEPDFPVGYELQNITSIGGLISGIGGLIVALYLAFLKK